MGPLMGRSKTCLSGIEFDLRTSSSSPRSCLRSPAHVEEDQLRGKSDELPHEMRELGRVARGQVRQGRTQSSLPGPDQPFLHSHTRRASHYPGSPRAPLRNRTLSNHAVNYAGGWLPKEEPRQAKIPQRPTVLAPWHCLPIFCESRADDMLPSSPAKRDTPKDDVLFKGPNALTERPSHACTPPPTSSPRPLEISCASLAGAHRRVR